MKTKLMMMAVAVVVAFGAWADTETIDDYTWTYRIKGDTAEIYNGYSAAISPSPTGAVTIPSTLGGKPVMSIGDYAFSGCDELTNVTIPNGITNIGYSAFSGCRELSEVEIPGSVTTILGYAFQNCESLTELEIPEGVVTLGRGIFEGCENLASIRIPSTVTDMETRDNGNPFDGAVNVAVSVDRRNPKYHMSNGQLVSSEGCLVSAFLVSDKVVIPPDVTRIFSNAFRSIDPKAITSITIPAHVTDVEFYAFGGCTNLKRVIFEEPAAGEMGLQRIGHYAFAYHCTSLNHYHPIGA